MLFLTNVFNSFLKEDTNKAIKVLSLTKVYSHLEGGICWFNRNLVEYFERNTSRNKRVQYRFHGRKGGHVRVGHHTYFLCQSQGDQILSNLLSSASSEPDTTCSHLESVVGTKDSPTGKQSLLYTSGINATQHTLLNVC